MMCFAVEVLIPSKGNGPLTARDRIASGVGVPSGDARGGAPMGEHRVEPDSTHTMEETDRLGGANIWTVIGASGVGTMIEWYDFYIFGSLALVLASQFFPSGNQTLAVL